jgi:hypothetical protein
MEWVHIAEWGAEHRQERGKGERNGEKVSGGEVGRKIGKIGKVGRVGMVGDVDGTLQ